MKNAANNISQIENQDRGDTAGVVALSVGRGDTAGVVALSVGAKVVVVKGCSALGITKGATAQVKAIVELGADYGYAVKVSLHFLNTFASGKTFSLTARHINRLSNSLVNLSGVRPEHKIVITLK